MDTPLNTLGASNLSAKDRSALDYYGTPPAATEALLAVEPFEGPVWECADGHGMITEVLREYGHAVRTSDLIDYGRQAEIMDFLTYTGSWGGDIITNPPYAKAAEFVSKALESVKDGAKVAMFLRLQFLEGQKRYAGIFKDEPPETVYVFVNRQVCSKDDSFTEGSAVSYAWFVWRKGFKGDTKVKWLSTKSE